MDSDRLNRWLSLAANLALLIGLILAALEIRQNSQLTRMQLVNEGNLGANQLYTAIMGENPMDAFSKSVENPEAMTFADFMVVDAFLRQYQPPQSKL